MEKKEKIKIAPKLEEFILKKRFVTNSKVYNIGDTFKHENKRVINFLKQQEII